MDFTPDYSDAARPYWKPRAEGFHPSGHPYIFLENGTQTVKMQFDTIPQKIQNRCNLHPCEDENCSGFHFAAHTTFSRAALSITPENTQRSTSHGRNFADCG